MIFLFAFSFSIEFSCNFQIHSALCTGYSYGNLVDLKGLLLTSMIARLVQ